MSVSPPLKGESRSDKAYNTVKDMAIGFQFLPNSRINEAELSTELGVSRTPLREALHRLDAEGHVRLIPGQGFFSRTLEPRDVFNLYELRSTIESKTVELAVTRATPEELAELKQFLEDTGPEEGGRSVEELVALDEHFHEGVARLTRNSELLKVLHNVNERVRFFRWVNMGSERRPVTQGEHAAILQAISDGETELAVTLMQNHVCKRMDQIIECIKEGLARIYLEDGFDDVGSYETK